MVPFVFFTQPDWNWIGMEAVDRISDEEFTNEAKQ